MKQQESKLNVTAMSTDKIKQYLIDTKPSHRTEGHATKARTENRLAAMNELIRRDMDGQA